MHLLDLNSRVLAGVRNAGLVGYQFNTIGVRYEPSPWAKGIEVLTLIEATESRWAQVGCGTHYSRGI